MGNSLYNNVKIKTDNSRLVNSIEMFFISLTLSFLFVISLVILLFSSSQTIEFVLLLIDVWYSSLRSIINIFYEDLMF